MMSIQERKNSEYLIRTSLAEFVDAVVEAPEFVKSQLSNVKVPYRRHSIETDSSFRRLKVTITIVNIYRR